MGAKVLIDFAPELRLFLKPDQRRGLVQVPADGTASLGHLIESLGVPLTEIGRPTVNGRAADPSHRPSDADTIRVPAVQRPQPLPWPPRFVLDVHLGTLARRLRLVGLDTAYRNDLDDDMLIHQANTERRVLLTKDRGLLRRRRLQVGAYVRSDQPDDQLADVLDRFAPAIAPWTRCPACNGLLEAIAKPEIVQQLKAGTQRTYHAFARCRSCHRLYWKGAHHPRLVAIVHTAHQTISRRIG